MDTTNPKTVWIDFENAPHVWVLQPILAALSPKRFDFLLTARDFSYTLELCRYHHLGVKPVGKPRPTQSTAVKIIRTFERTLLLTHTVLTSGARRRIILALCHGSRAQTIAARLLNIPVVSLEDYEYSDQSLVPLVTNLLIPFPISPTVWKGQARKVVHYPGLKEDIYLCSFQPPGDRTGRDPARPVKILFRPEGRFTHYHADHSRALQETILRYLAQHGNVSVTLLPRDPVQRDELSRQLAALAIDCTVPTQTLDGPALIWDHDLIIGGGGTMTREAAVLQVPAYSFFAGPWGGVDQYLVTQKRLTRIREAGDIRKIEIIHRKPAPVRVSAQALRFITAFLEEKLG